jgi:hypothetical protein
LKLAWGDDTKKGARRSKILTAPRADAHSLPMLLTKDPSCMPSGEP